MSYDIMSFHVMSHFILDYILYHMLYCIWSVIFIYHISYSLSSVSETIYNLQYHKSLTFYCVTFFYISIIISSDITACHFISCTTPWCDIVSYTVYMYVCTLPAYVFSHACMYLWIMGWLHVAGIISWSCLHDFLLVDANAVVVLLVIDPGAISEKQQGHVERTWRTIWQVTQTQFPPNAETLNWKIDANEAWCRQCAPWWFPTQLNEFCRYTHQISCCKKISMNMSKLNHILYLKQRRRKNPTVQFGPVPLESSSP